MPLSPAVGAVLDALQSRVAVVDGDGRIVAVNEAWRIGAGERAPAIASAGADYLALLDSVSDAPATGSARTAAALREVLAGREHAAHLEISCGGSDDGGDASGATWYDVGIRAFTDGELRGAVVTYDDITLQREGRMASERAALARREEAELVATLQRIGIAVSSELDLDRLVQLVTDEATRLTEAQFGAFFYNVTNETGESYTLYSLSGVPREAFSKFPMPRNTPVFGPTFRGDGTVRSDDILADPRYGKMAPYHGMPRGHLPVRSYLAVPVISRTGEVIGGLFFGHPDTGRFTDRAQRLVEGIAGWAALSVDNARLYRRERQARIDAETAWRRAEEATRAKGDFLATMSHELRTPLNAIQGHVQLLDMGVYGPLTDEQREALGRVARAEHHLLALINDVLNLARLDAGRVEYDIHPVLVADVLSSVLPMIGPQIAAKQHTLEARMPEDSGLDPVYVLADREKLGQVLLNLLSNAVKFTPEGGRITIEFVNREHDVGDPRVAHIRVSDTGHGIPRDKLETIFEPFVQLDRSLASGHEGTGLGLAISRDLMRGMGGDLRARSTEGEGSRFTVTLPRA